MKRSIIIMLVVLLATGTTLFAQNAASANTKPEDKQNQVLIDFSKLTADWPSDKPTENTATMIDFSAVAGSSFSEDEKKMMKTSLAVANWEVVLSSSSRSVANQTLTMAKPAKITKDVKFVDEKDTIAKDSTVIGIRIHYPEDSYNSYAILQPPFDIPDRKSVV